MPEQSERTARLPIAKRAVALLFLVFFVGLFLAFVRPEASPAQAQFAGQAYQQEPDDKSDTVPPGLVQAQSTAQGGQAVQQTVVGEKCMQCHKEVVQSFALDNHGKSAKFLKNSRAASCESCHGDGTKHNETGEPRDISNPPNLTKAQVNESCLQCHARDRTHLSWRGGQHDRSDMSCLSCHSAHHAKSEAKMLTRRTEEETCLSCHSNRRADFNKRSTHLFRTEDRNMKVGCSSCHNPHGGEGGKMLTNHSVNGLCYTCHAEKRAPVLWDHPPVRENCLNCHSPHGSSNPKLLTARTHLLCQQCHIHMLPRHSTTAGKPLDIWSFNRGCVNCHAMVHGSNHPGGRTLSR